MSARFEGRSVVVTGGFGALGSVAVARLLEEGAEVHLPVHGTSAPKVDWSGHAKVHAIPGIDLTDSAAVDRFYGSVPDLWASIHLAGGFAMAPIEEATADALSSMLSINAVTAFLCCRAAVRRMVDSGTAGRIVNVTARPGVEPRRGSGMAGYAASKAAVAALTAALAEELKGRGILVNAVAPSTLDTPANRTAMPKADPAKWISLDDAVETILHLASPQNAVASGAVVPLYGRA
jgi:NAD(P)-dependent dehydrogenase (short-subunit alcohol dehydrogenase family)